MLQSKPWKGCVFLHACIVLVLLVCNAASGAASSENSGPSEFAAIVQSKQAKRARICRADPQLLGSLAGSSSDDAEVMVTVPNEHLEPIAEFQEEADLWVATHVARFVPTTRITHVLVGDDVLSSFPGDAAAYFLVPVMLRLRSALAAAGLDGVRVSTALSADALAAPARPDVATRLLRFLKATGAPLFLKSGEAAAGDAEVDAAFAAMRALGVSDVLVIDIGAASGDGGLATYYSYGGYGSEGGGGKRRSLATTGTFCVALQNADPTALQAGLNWACGPGHADCSAIQPGGACYKANNLPALASYAYNDYYQKQASKGATCSFNGTATTTTTDPSSGSCVFAGSSTSGGGTNPTPPVGASPPTSLAPPAGFTPPFGSSPPSSDLSPPAFGTTPPAGFITPPAGGGFGPPSFGSPPSEFGPPGAFNGSGSFGPSGTLEPYGAGSRGAASSAGLTALSAVAVAFVLTAMDVM